MVLVWCLNYIEFVFALFFVMFWLCYLIVSVLGVVCFRFVFWLVLDLLMICNWFVLFWFRFCFLDCFGFVFDLCWSCVGFVLACVCVVIESYVCLGVVCFRFVLCVVFGFASDLQLACVGLMLALFLDRFGFVLDLSWMSVGCVCWHVWFCYRIVYVFGVCFFQTCFLFGFWCVSDL